MGVYKLGEHTPKIHENAWVAKTAKVIGQVELSEGSSIWFGAVLRGDFAGIRIGRNTSIQDNAVLHADPATPLTIGDNALVAHQAMVHGCTIGDGTLIGIQAVVMNGAKIGRNCIVGAGSMVTEGKTFPDGVLILGSPAQVVRELTPEQLAGMQRGVAAYVENARRYRTELKRIDS
jgi:carbonic anhydrase/acetyltransferase-like protein (isoleucine patch superfamily)